MKKLFYFVLCYCCFGLDINAYLEKNDAMLWNFYQQVIKQSAQKNYPLYANKPIITQKHYQNLSKEEKQSFDYIALIAFYPQSKPLYNDFGGVSIKGILAEDIEDRNAKVYFYIFDGRYYTDLTAITKDKRIYAYCKPPRLNHCILLGIGEEW